MVWMMDFGKKIAALAELRGIPMKQIATTAGVAYGTLRSYTRSGSERVPSATVGIALAKALDVPTEWLFDDECELPPPPRLGGPPGPIYPWPPDGITWDQVRIAITRYILDLYMSRIPHLGREVNAERLERTLEWLFDHSPPSEETLKRQRSRPPKKP